MFIVRRAGRPRAPPGLGYVFTFPSHGLEGRAYVPLPLPAHGQRCPARHRGELARGVRVFVPEESRFLPEESAFLPEKSAFFPQLRANATTERDMRKPRKGV